MKGIADGAGIEYDKILFLNTLVTISEHGKCFAFSFRQTESNIITVRQIDISNDKWLSGNGQSCMHDSLEKHYIPFHEKIESWKPVPGKKTGKYGY